MCFIFIVRMFFINMPFAKIWSFREKNKKFQLNKAKSVCSKQKDAPPK